MVGASSNTQVNANTNDNPYLRKLQDSCALHLRNRLHCENMQRDHGDSGLFHLFLSRKFFTCLLHWTNLKVRGMRTTQLPVKLSEIYVFIGISLYMSIVRLPELNMYWSKKVLGLTPLAGQFMGRDRFLFIWTNIQFHPASTLLSKPTDPLYHSRIMMEELFQNSTTVAVPQGCFALDENSIPTKARTRALSYQKDKPDLWAIRLYALCSHSSAYLYSCWDNIAAKKARGICGAISFSKLFRDIGPLYNNAVVHNTDGVDPESASALWVLMMSQPVLRAAGHNKKFTYFTDSFYTRPALAKLLYACTDGNAAIIGTLKSQI